MAFTEGRDLSQPEQVLEAARRCGLDPDWVTERIGQQDLKDRLRDATEAAHARGVFGVPTLVVGERLFWGDDQLELAAS
jgi:2-hydroxychromene-2-carboxylate isomerase